MNNSQPFSGFSILVVEAGTEVEVEGNDGPETVIITDDEVLFSGRDCYMTPIMHENVQNEIDLVKGLAATKKTK